jgi:hypothetical protein
MTRQQLYTHIRAYNRHLTRDHLDTLSWVDLLRNCHPLDRMHFAHQLKDEGKIIEADLAALRQKFASTKTLDEPYGYKPSHKE